MNSKSASLTLANNILLATTFLLTMVPAVDAAPQGPNVNASSHVNSNAVNHNPTLPSHSSVGSIVSASAAGQGGPNLTAALGNITNSIAHNNVSNVVSLINNAGGNAGGVHNVPQALNIQAIQHNITNITNIPHVQNILANTPAAINNVHAHIPNLSAVTSHTMSNVLNSINTTNPGGAVNHSYSQNLGQQIASLVQNAGNVHNVLNVPALAHINHNIAVLNIQNSNLQNIGAFLSSSVVAVNNSNQGNNGGGGGGVQLLSLANTGGNPHGFGNSGGVGTYCTSGSQGANQTPSLRGFVYMNDSGAPAAACKIDFISIGGASGKNNQAASSQGAGAEGQLAALSPGQFSGPYAERFGGGAQLTSGASSSSGTASNTATGSSTDAGGGNTQVNSGTAVTSANPNDAIITGSSAGLFESDAAFQASLPKDPFANGLIATDLTPVRMPKASSPSHCEPLRLEPDSQLSKNADPATVSYVVAVDPRAPYGFTGDDETVILAAAKTRFNTAGNRRILLKEGEVTVTTGSKPATVIAGNGAVTVPANSAITVTQSHAGVLNVSHVSGSDASVTLSYRGNSGKTTVRPGHELRVESSSVASAGASDYVASSTASPVPGLNVSSRPIDAADDQSLNRLRDCKIGCLTSAMRRRIDDIVGRYSSLTGAGPVDGFVADSAKQTASRDLLTMATESATIKYSYGSSVTLNAKGNVSLQHGSMLVASPKGTNIEAAGHNIEIKSNAIVLLTVQSGVLKIHNLHDSSSSSVAVQFGKEWVPVRVGNELVIASEQSEVTAAMNNDGIGRRCVTAVENAKNHQAFCKSEFSLPTLLGYSGILRQVFKSEEPSDRRLKDSVIKTAVCLFQTTYGHGSYNSIASVASR